jgi:uncharacterized membrane protein YdbT with pleckstrin-like domain
VPFSRRLLDEGEEVVLAGPSAALVAAIAVAIVVSTWTNRGVVLIPLLLAVLVALGWFVARVVTWAATGLVLTTRRVVIRAGLLGRRGRELSLARVHDITITRTLSDRVLGAGDLVIEPVGARGGETFVRCPHPRRVRDEIRRRVEASRTGPADGRSPRHDLAPLDQLDRLDDLRRRGVISQAEFDAKKTQLLGRL